MKAKKRFVKKYTFDEDKHNEFMVIATIFLVGVAVGVMVICLYLINLLGDGLATKCVLFCIIFEMMVLLILAGVSSIFFRKVYWEEE
jgi:uncharacterized membrane protein (DUF485 family)